MLLDGYHTVEGGRVTIAPEQASRFAKEVAGDFNPIHDAEARRFCVPGDLLCALVLGHYGLSERMHFRFLGMVGRDTPLVLPPDSGDTLALADTSGRGYLEVERDGETVHDSAVVDAFIHSYSAFSGRNFPEFLTPLMEEQGVMFNPARPLVLYDSMAFALQRPVGADVEMTLDNASLEVAGRRGEEWLRFRIRSGGEVIGHGSKKVVISGLQDWDSARMGAFVADYTARRDHFSP